MISIPDKQTLRKQALAARAKAHANAADDVFTRIINTFKEGPLTQWQNFYSHPGQDEVASRDLGPQVRANGPRSRPLFNMIGPGMTKNDESFNPIIAGYWPFGSEFDTRPLLHALHDEGYDIALPVVHPSDHMLLFRRWTPGTILEADRVGVMSPPHNAELLEPDILIVPIVAFSDEGHRLGYGKGYYDVTLAALRGRRGILTVGLAYPEQRVSLLPYEPHDQKLDIILTPGRQGGIGLAPPPIP